MDIEDHRCAGCKSRPYRQSPCRILINRIALINEKNDFIILTLYAYMVDFTHSKFQVFVNCILISVKSKSYIIQLSNASPKSDILSKLNAIVDKVDLVVRKLFSVCSINVFVCLFIYLSFARECKCVWVCLFIGRALSWIGYVEYCMYVKVLQLIYSLSMQYHILTVWFVTLVCDKFCKFNCQPTDHVHWIIFFFCSCLRFEIHSHKYTYTRTFFKHSDSRKYLKENIDVCVFSYSSIKHANSNRVLNQDKLHFWIVCSQLNRWWSSYPRSHSSCYV